ncbi:MAG TPA: hypothetical protein VKW76_12520 [Candidatus Binatia bacterium]|nr:hypothetical protein [Candidatus Binatia bacterium]
MMPIMTVPLGAIVGTDASVPFGLSLPVGFSWLAPLAFGAVLWIVLLVARSSIRTAVGDPRTRCERPTLRRLAA